MFIKYNIDITKLERNYITSPLKKVPRKINGGVIWEFPTKNDMIYLYNKLNMRIDDLSLLLSIPKFVIIKCINEYNIHKSNDKRYFNIKETCNKLYNSDNVFEKHSSLRSKIDNVFKEKYGVNNPFQLETVKNKIKDTCIKKYGVDNYTKTREYKKKAKETNIKKYGVDSYSKTEQYKQKYKNKNYVNKVNHNIYQIKKINGSLGKSKEEDKIYELLKQKYPNTIHHYKSDLYPYVCDFYIPEIDTYIEYQGYFTHGKEPYIGTNEQKEIVKLWESKNTPQYKRAIKTWTIEDVLKREIVKKNNLNYLEFFNITQFMEWYNKQGENNAN